MSDSLWIDHVNSRSELTQRSVAEAETDSALRDIWVSLLSELGPRAWQWDQLVLMKRQVLSRLLHFNQIYEQIIDVPGVICEFGVQWGAGLTTLINLRGIHEPYNHARHIYGFDTFEGFKSVDSSDGTAAREGAYSVTEAWEVKLNEILNLHERNAPLSHMDKFSLIKGDVSLTASEWEKNNPATLIAMAIFDLDIYRPTLKALEMVIPKLSKGSVLVFDELGSRNFPGETKALLETLNLGQLRLRHSQHQPYVTWCVWGD